MAADAFVGLVGEDPVALALVAGASLVLIGSATETAAAILPHAMGFAAGGMLYVISGDIIPETHTRGYERVATLGTMAGVLIMLYLDVSLG